MIDAYSAVSNFMDPATAGRFGAGSHRVPIA
ncbi:hypothetical protein MNBD_ACTINO02-1596 [hydrothermal vent metagenome]|uniref:Uncharacterized protein n=1 Tax=hydrothermal vent metagenome TaxID=652676 RepID=A0A3B0RD64_9ZZZZ